MASFMASPLVRRHHNEGRNDRKTQGNCGVEGPLGTAFVWTNAKGRGQTALGARSGAFGPRAALRSGMPCDMLEVSQLLSRDRFVSWKRESPDWQSVARELVPRGRPAGARAAYVCRLVLADTSAQKSGRQGASHVPGRPGITASINGSSHAHTPF